MFYSMTFSYIHTKKSSYTDIFIHQHFVKYEHVKYKDVVNDNMVITNQCHQLRENSAVSGIRTILGDVCSLQDVDSNSN